MTADAFRIVRAEGATDLAAVAGLFRDYAAWIDVDLSQQGLEAELAALPGAYAPPKGELLLARDPAGTPIGCIALKPLSVGACEIKRLYVRPEARGLGLGRALAEAIIAAAERIGYREIKLDTLESMTSAIAVYRGLGFEPIPDYGTVPYPGLLCFGKRLRGG